MGGCFLLLLAVTVTCFTNYFFLYSTTLSRTATEQKTISLLEDVRRKWSRAEEERMEGVRGCCFDLLFY